MPEGTWPSRSIRFITRLLDLPAAGDFTECAIDIAGEREQDSASRRYGVAAGAAPVLARAAASDRAERSIATAA